MDELQELLDTHVAAGTVPGAVALVAHGDRVEVRTAGFADVESGTPMAADSIFRLASITKPIVAAAVLVLIEDGVLALDDPVAKWLPELASPKVVRTPDGPVDDLVPAVRPITVAHLLTSTAGYGFSSDFSRPAVQALFTVQKDGREPQHVPPPDEWLAALARIPLVHQPGEGWLYNTTSDLQGVLIARASGRPLPEFLAERLFEPLGMTDTGFAVPPGKLHRLTTYYRHSPGGFERADGPDGQWSHLPAFPSGAGGLVSTARDWHRFARMLLAGGEHVLSAESVRQMITDRLTPAQREGSELFLEGQSWGYGGAVDVEPVDPWTVPGRYGWVGGTGTTAHLIPSTGTIAILLTQVASDGPVTPESMRDFWSLANAERTLPQ
ncbi:serine hydrolase [Amycolatopsis sp. 195334CR]|uniref:serine hydrolase domain-containing protein n=1 Tax=Amycolatopsis sp. 195334CR TaxID=2814588 RepID=UPI001A8E2793|nr:serine hydrolase domain-containing protein [Amycolatopsis sp. 195334CR]MBN6039505.1 beta-lactamase family protein [Amycolatopsis sp. 195334CR]